MSNHVKVQIFGQSYTMGGDLDEQYVQNLAQYVDEKMRVVAENARTLDSVRVAVLAALAIADELHTLRHENTQHQEELRERAQHCLTAVEKALRQSTSPAS